MSYFPEEDFTVNEGSDHTILSGDLVIIMCFRSILTIKD